MGKNHKEYDTGIPELDSLLKEKIIKSKEIELLSEEVQEVMDAIPPWILRNGITTLFIIVLLLLAGSWMFKYPDVIQAEVTVTSLDPPVSIIARSSGKIDEIYVENNRPVKQGEQLAIIQNPANTADMLCLLENMEKWRASGYDVEAAAELFPSQSVSLGNIQPVYAAFLNSLNDFRNYKELDYYPQKIASKKQQLAAQREYYDRIIKQSPVINEQFHTSKNIFERDSILLSKKIISENEYDMSKSSFLQNKQSYLSFNASLKQSELQLMQGGENLLDLRQQASELESGYRLSLHNAMEALDAHIKTWKHDYLMSSPVTGTVNQMGIWSSNQNVAAGETVFTVVPDGQDTPRGKAMLPVQGAGKVKAGQRVNVRVNNFPDQEFGYLIGEVSGISSVPISTQAGDFYVVEITFPDGMETNYGKTLPVTRQMAGIADIITEDLRLMERLFMPLKKILENQK
ncbi:HlyD family efflux transporter periplasmic adaptor subunit [Bacteroides sp.]|uniref:HlyD family secretion protein n=1 Tax=Bacteroides sp. TaxID=29523 RepID=UPI0025906662|nr:HlyD family efflux transporter periplasmic adaptor subunit [Bacteroides sp.]